MFFVYKRGCKSYVNSCRDWTLAISVGWWELVLVSHFGLVWTAWVVRRRDMSCLDVLQSFRLVWTIWTGRWRGRFVWTYCKRSFLGIVVSPDGPTTQHKIPLSSNSNRVPSKTPSFRPVRTTWPGRWIGRSLERTINGQLWESWSLPMDSDDMLCSFIIKRKGRPRILTDVSWDYVGCLSVWFSYVEEKLFVSFVLLHWNPRSVAMLFIGWVAW